ncbi:GNAT family N-acetyltransferase [Streptomyces fulvoviolaceus]
METARPAPRRFASGDAQALAAYRSEPEVSRYQGPGSRRCRWRRPSGWWPSSRSAIPTLQCGVERRGAPGAVGDLRVCRSEGGRQAELGLTFAPAFQGRGYAIEAVAYLIVEFLLVDEGPHRVSAAATDITSARRNCWTVRRSVVRATSSRAPGPRGSGAMAPPSGPLPRSTVRRSPTGRESGPFLSICLSYANTW